MQDCFNGALSFNQPLNNWDTSNVKTMYCMFREALVFDKAHIEGWDMKKNKNDGYMFVCQLVRAAVLYNLFSVGIGVAAGF